MPRVARIYTDDGIFHVLTRGNNKQWIFHDKEDFSKYKGIIKEVKEEQPFKLCHYCLMSNHVHMLIETNEKTRLSKLMKRINLKYYHYYKKKYGYAGHFWQDRYKSLLVEGESYLLSCGIYIERNPLRAKMVKFLREYKLSSYRYYAYGVEDELVDRDQYYEELGKNDNIRQQRYKELLLGEEERKIEQALKGQLFLGTEKFVGRMEKVFNVINTRLKKGRPRIK
jgi:putative transposase